MQHPFRTRKAPNRPTCHEGPKCQHFLDTTNGPNIRKKRKDDATPSSTWKGSTCSHGRPALRRVCRRVQTLGVPPNVGNRIAQTVVAPTEGSKVVRTERRWHQLRQMSEATTAQLVPFSLEKKRQVGAVRQLVGASGVSQHPFGAMCSVPPEAVRQCAFSSPWISLFTTRHC